MGVKLMTKVVQSYLLYAYVSLCNFFFRHTIAARGTSHEKPSIRLYNFKSLFFFRIDVLVALNTKITIFWNVIL
jgi:hypothetical protein